MGNIKWTSVWIGGLALLTLGCKEKTQEPILSEMTSFAVIQDRIFTPSCATAGCHASEQDKAFNQHGLVLTKGKSYASLLNILSRQPEAQAEGMKRVKPFNANESRCLSLIHI